MRISIRDENETKSEYTRHNNFLGDTLLKLVIVMIMITQITTNKNNNSKHDGYF